MSGSSQKVGRFIVSDTEKGIVFNDINYNWKYSITRECPSYQSLKYSLDNMDSKNIEILVTTMYTFTNLMMKDAELVGVVNNYFRKRLNPDVAKEVTEEEDSENLKIAKDDSEEKLHETE
jgi:hypothetical protein